MMKTGTRVTATEKDGTTTHGTVIGKNPAGQTVVEWDTGVFTIWTDK